MVAYLVVLLLLFPSLCHAQFNDGGVFNKGILISTTDDTVSVKAKEIIFPDGTINDMNDGSAYINLYSLSEGNSITFDNNSGIVFPHLMMSDSSTQTIQSTASAQVITFNTTIHSKNVTVTSPSRFTIQKTGTYLLAISAIADTTVATGNHIEIWLRVNGADVPDSNTRIYLTRDAQTIVAVTFLQQFNMNDYFEFWTWGDNVGCRWLAYGGGNSPKTPAVPSIIMTANYVSLD